MSTDRVAVVEDSLDRLLAELPPAERPLDPGQLLHAATTLRAAEAVRLFEDQLTSRCLDVAARQLKKRDLSYYTISSAGHEQNAILGAQVRTTDPCYLHYRSGALMVARARRLAGSSPIFDTLLSLCASSDDPVCQGRHKVWGSRATWVPPQTSTIASHVPKATGAAFALGRSRRLKIDPGIPADSIVCCSFGDASLNHATALSGLNAARYALRRGNPTPILFVCEDNGLGISVDTPRRWVQDTVNGMSELEVFEADGPLDAIWDTVGEAIATCRQYRVPVFLHLPTVRLWGHAGSDLETGYHTLEQIEATEARDPLQLNARRLVELGAATPGELREMVAAVRAQVAAVAEEAATRPKLSRREDVMRPLAPYDEAAVREAGRPSVSTETRRAHFGARLPEEQSQAGRRTLSAHLNSALHDLMLQHREIVIFGEDVGRKGGVYGLTARLQERFGKARAFDTLLDETTILGVAQGAGQMGMLPIPEIQYLAYVHNALDQLRGEACSLQFFSNGQFQNPMVVRIASFGYQRGFGGHFHNDASIGALRDIPGLMLAAPSRGDDAARMLRGAVATARACGRVVAFLEPIALYHRRDLHEEGDEGWLSDYPDPAELLLPGEVGLHGDEDPEILLVSYANGVVLSHQAARRLREEGRRVGILDLRWLAPLPWDALRRHLQRTPAVLVVDECRATGGGIADAVVARLAEEGYGGRLGSVRSADSYVPLGPAAHSVLVSEDDIVRAVEELVR